MWSVFITLPMLFILSIGASWADVVELRTGERVEGTFKQATPAGVMIEVGGQTLTFEQERVRAIYFGSAPSVQGQTSAMADALAALKELQSVVSGGVNYRDYGRRVGDAKIRVDRYLQGPDQEDALVKKAIADAMRFYASAALAWSARISNDYLDSRRVGNDPSVKDCPHMATVVNEIMEARPANTNLPESQVIGIIVGLHFQPLWVCAAEKIAEAELLARSMRDESAK